MFSPFRLLPVENVSIFLYFLLYVVFLPADDHGACRKTAAECRQNDEVALVNLARAVHLI